MSGYEHVAPAWVLVFPLVGALILPLIGRRWPGAVHGVALLAVGCSAVAALYTATLVVTVGVVTHTFGNWEPPWGIQFRVDHLGAAMVVLITVISFLVLLWGHDGQPERLRRRNHFYYALYLLFTMGLSGFVLTGDLFNLYVFLEVIALTGYALIAVGDPQAPFAAFRYMILGTLGASAYLVGLAYLYGMTGSLNFMDVAQRLAAVDQPRTAFVALSLLVAGFGIKAALFPLHAWLPDAYSFSPPVTTAFMAAVGTKIGAYGIFRVLYTIYRIGDGAGHTLPVTTAMAWLSGAGIILGSIFAIAQTDLKRMLAYSSVSQIGYVLLGFSLANGPGITGGVLHMINHAVMKCALFLVAGVLASRLGHRDIRRFDGIGLELPFTMAVFGVASLSMVGLPPTAGFFSKWYLVVGAVEAGRWPFVVIILLSSLLNAIYFIRILERAFLRPRKDRTADAKHPPLRLRPLSASMQVPMGVMAVAILVLGLGSWPLVEHVVRFVVPVSVGAG
ncbi:MAG: monovalent cation/H+ antiporter subunit D family protein [Deltaproteobacteria bacterium]|nr:MAG: monovalent cation/H+ antiporter subunit D family protein [Deltaproteobacteria bacterium]